MGWIAFYRGPLKRRKYVCAPSPGWKSPQTLTIEIMVKQSCLTRPPFKFVSGADLHPLLNARRARRRDQIAVGQLLVRTRCGTNIAHVAIRIGTRGAPHPAGRGILAGHLSNDSHDQIVVTATITAGPTVAIVLKISVAWAAHPPTRITAITGSIGPILRSLNIYALAVIVVTILNVGAGTGTGQHGKIFQLHGGEPTLGRSSLGGGKDSAAMEGAFFHLYREYKKAGNDDSTRTVAKKAAIVK